MRITITLEDDVAASLKRLGQVRRLKFKALVNLVLREGIRSMMGPVRKRKTFQTRSVNLGPCRIANLDNVAEVLSIAEGDKGLLPTRPRKSPPAQ
jgi:hypothetical protein